jgi:hypothetical protein
VDTGSAVSEYGIVKSLTFKDEFVSDFRVDPKVDTVSALAILETSAAKLVSRGLAWVMACTPSPATPAGNDAS